MRSTLLLFIVSLTGAAAASTTTIGVHGIRSTSVTLPNGFSLNGDGVGVGQVEDNRAGKPDYDTDFNKINDAIKPHKVFQHSATAGVNLYIGNHAISVAGIVIGDGSEGGGSRGVAPKAKLYSGAAQSIADVDDLITTLHKIATFPISLEVPDVKVINMSYAFEYPDFDISRDGNFELTKYVDWSAARHDITYVIAAASNLSTNADSPSENFNGITVVASEVRNGENDFREVAGLNVFSNDFDAAGDRVSTDIMAPGVDVPVAIGGDGSVPDFSGTSAAAPHVAGAVALLQQYANYRVDHSGWNPISSRRHEVMKAVLLNSADKIEGIHGSKRDIASQNFI